MTESRSAELRRFVAAHLRQSQFSLSPASADASFRSYWRVVADAKTLVVKTFVVMDAPPEKENIDSWLDIGSRLHAAGLHTPQVHAVDVDRGFILMEDLGARAYLPELNAGSADALYGDALGALLTMQTQVSTAGLPKFDDAFVRMELDIMPAWFLGRHFGVAPNRDEQGAIDTAFACLIDNARSQPQVFMHRDFHSRNLMYVEQGNPGIIDFQGAVLGPVAYDLASLLRDCYIAWPAAQVDAWTAGYHSRLRASGVVDADSEQFRRWFDLIGLQRHIKVLGLFCRLHYRDGKPAYLNDLPLVLHYVLGTARRYPELAAFAEVIERATAARDVTVARKHDDLERP